MNTRIMYVSILMVSLCSRAFAQVDNDQGTIRPSGQIRQRLLSNQWAEHSSDPPPQSMRAGSVPDSQSASQSQVGSNLGEKQEEQKSKDRCYGGSVFQFSRVSSSHQLTVSPVLGYRLLPYLFLGLNAGMQITVEHFSKGQINYRWKPDYGLFTEWHKKSWFLHIQYVDRWKKLNSSETGVNPAQWFAGVGKTYHLNTIKGRIMMLYNLQNAQVTAALDCQVRKGHIMVFFNPRADALKQQKTWTLKWGIDLW